MFEVIFSMRIKSKMKLHSNISIIITLLLTTFIQVQGTKIYEPDTCTPVCWTDFLQRNDAPDMLQEMIQTISTYGSESPQMAVLLQTLITETGTISIVSDVVMDTKVVEVVETIDEVLSSPVLVGTGDLVETSTLVVTEKEATPVLDPIVFQPPAMDPELIEAVPTYIEELITNQELECSIPPAELNDFLSKILTLSDTSFFDIPLAGSLSMSLSSSSSSSSEEELITEMVVKRKQTMIKKNRIVLKKRILRYLQQVIEQKALPAELMNRLVDYIDYLGQDLQIIGQEDDEIVETINQQDTSPIMIQDPILDPSFMVMDSTDVSVQNYVTGLLSNQNLVSDLPHDELGFILNQVLAGSDTKFLDTLPLMDTSAYSTEVLDIESSISDVEMIVESEEIGMTVTRPVVVDYLQQIIARGTLPIDLINRLYGYVKFMTKGDSTTANYDTFVPVALNADILDMLPAYIDEIVTDPLLMSNIPIDQRRMLLNQIFTGSDLLFYEALPASLSSISTSTLDVLDQNSAVKDVKIVTKKQRKSKKTKISKKRIIKYLQQVIEKKALPSEMLTRLSDYLDFIQEDGQYIRTVTETVIEETVEEKPKGKFSLAITGIDAVDIVKPVGKATDKLTLKLNGGGMKGLLEKLGSFSDSSEEEDKATLAPDFKFAFPFDENYLSSMYPDVDFKGMVTKYLAGEKIENEIDNELFETPLAELDLEEKKIAENAEILQDNWMDVVGELGLLMKSEKDIEGVDELTTIVKDLQAYVPQQSINAADNLVIKKIKKIIQKLNDFFTTHPTLKNVKKYGDIVKGLKTNLKFSEKFFKKIKSISIKRSSIRKIVNKKKYSTVVEKVQEKLKSLPEILKQESSVVGNVFTRIMNDLENFMAWRPSDVIQDNYTKLLSRMHDFMNEATTGDVDVDSYNGEIMNEIEMYMKEEVSPRNLASYVVVESSQSSSSTNNLENLEEIPEFIVEEGFNVEFIDEIETCCRLITELESLIDSRSTSVYSFKYKKITTKLTKYIQNLKQYGINAVCPEEYQLALEDLEKYITSDPTIVTPDRYLKLISDINYNIDMISYDTVDVDPFVERSVGALESYFESNPKHFENVDVSVKITKIRKFIKSVKRYGIRSVNIKQYSEIIQGLVEDLTQNDSLNTSLDKTTEMTYFLNQISDYIENPNYIVHQVDPNFVKLISDIEYFLSTNTEIQYTKYTKYVTTLYKFVHEVERFGLEVVHFNEYKIEVEQFIKEIREDDLISDENTQIFVYLINEIYEQVNNSLLGTQEIDPFIEKSIIEIESFMRQKDVKIVFKYYQHIVKLRRYVSSVKKFGLQAVVYEDYHDLLNEIVEEVREDDTFENSKIFEDLVSQTSSFIVDSSYGLYEVDPFISRSISTLESYFLAEPRADYSRYSVHITKLYKYISEVKRFGMGDVDTAEYINILDEINQEIFKDMSIDDIDKYTHLIGQVTGYLKESSKIESSSISKSVDPFIERSINMLESFIQSDTKILHTTRYKKIITKIYKYISDVRVYGIESVDLNNYQTVLNQFSQYITTDPSIENCEQYTELVNEISEYISDTRYGTYEFDPFVEKSIIELENYLQVSSSVVYKRKYSKIIRKLYKHVSNVKRYGSSAVDTEDYQRIIAELQAEIALDEFLEEDCDFYLGLVDEISEIAQDTQVLEYIPVDPFIERAIFELEKYLQTSSGMVYTTKYSIHITKLYKYISDWRRYGVTAIDHEYYMKTLSELMESVHEELGSESSKTCIDLILQISDYFDTPSYVTHDLDSYKLLISDFESYLTTDPVLITNKIFLDQITKLKTYVTEVKTFGKSSIPVETYRSVLTDLEKTIISDLDIEAQKRYIDLISQISVHFEDSTDSCVDNLHSYKMVVTDLESTLRSDTRIEYTTSISLLVTKLHKYISDVKRYGLSSVNTGHYIEVITQLSNALSTVLEGDLETYTEIFNQIFSYFRTPSYVNYDLDEYSSLVTSLDNFFQQEAKVVYTRKTTTLIKKLYRYTSVVKKYGIGAVDVDSYRVLLNELQNEIMNLDGTYVDISKFTEITSEISNYFETTTLEPQELNSYRTLISNFETVLQANTINSVSSTKYILLLKKLHKYTSDIERYGISAVDVAYYQNVLSELSTEITKDTTLEGCEILKDYISQIQEIYDPNDNETNELNLYRTLMSEMGTVLMSSSKKSTEYKIILKKLTKYISDVKRFGVVSLDNEHYSRLVQQLNNLIILDESVDVKVTTDLIKQLEGFFVTPDYVTTDFEPYCNLVTELENVFSADTSVVYATKYSLKITKLQKFVKRIRKYGVKAVDMTQYKELLTSLSHEITTDPEIESVGEYTSMISQISTYFDPPTTNIVNTVVDPFQELVSDLETFIKQDKRLIKSTKITILIQKLYKYSADVKSFGATAVDLQYYQDILSQFNEELEMNSTDKELYQDMLSQISDYFGVPTYVNYNSDPYTSVVTELEAYLKPLPNCETYLELLMKLQKYCKDIVVYGKNNVDNHYYQLIVSQLWNSLSSDTGIENLDVFEDVISEISDYFDTSCHVEFDLDPYKHAVTELETYIQQTTLKTTTKTTIKRTTLIKKLYKYINDVEAYGIDAVDPDHYTSILHELQEDLGLDEVVDEGYSNLISQVSEYFVNPSYVSYDLQPYTDLITKLDTYLSTESNDLYLKTYTVHLKKLSKFTIEAVKYGIGVVDTNAYSFTLSQLLNDLEKDGVLKDTTIYEGLITELSTYFETDQNLSNLDQYTSLITEIEDRFQTGHTVLFTKKYSKYVRKLRKYVVDVKKYGIKYVDPTFFNTVLGEMMSEISADPEIEDVVWYENNVSQLNELLVIPDYESFNVDPYETLITNLEDTLTSSSTVSKVVYSRKYSLKMKKLRKYSKIVKKYGISAVDSQYYNGLLSEIKSDINKNLETSGSLSDIFSDISTYIETPSFFLHTSDPFTTLLTELEGLINSEINVFHATKYYPLVKNLFGYISNIKQFGLKVLEGENHYQDLMQIQKMLSEEPNINSFGKYSTLLMLVSKAFDDSCGVLPDSELLINLLFDVENHISEETQITNHNQYFTTIGNLYDFLLDVHLFGTQGVNRDLYRDMVTHVSEVISSDTKIQNQHTYVGTLSRVSTYLTCSSLFPYSTENFRQLMAKLEELISREPKLIFRYKYLPIIYDLYNYIPDFQYLGTEGTRSEHYRNILYEFRASIAIEPNLLDDDIYFEVIEDILEEIDRPFHFSREVKPFMKLIGEMEKVIELEPDLVNTIYYRKHLLKLRHYISHRHAVKNLDLELDYISVIVDDVVKTMSLEPNVLDQTTFDRLVSRLRKHVKVSKKTRLSIPLDTTDSATMEEIEEFVSKTSNLLAEDNINSFLDDDRLAMELGLSSTKHDPHLDTIDSVDPILNDISGLGPNSERMKLLSMIRKLSKPGSTTTSSPDALLKLKDYYRSKFGELDLLDEEVGENLLSFGEPNLILDDDFGGSFMNFEHPSMYSSNFGGNPSMYGNFEGHPPSNLMNLGGTYGGMDDPSYFFNNPVIIQPVPVFVSGPLPNEVSPEVDPASFLSVMGAETIAKLVPPGDNTESYTLHIEGIDTLEQLEALRAAVENNGLLIAGLDTMAVQAPPADGENFDGYMALDQVAEMYAEMTAKIVEEILDTEYELLSDLQIQNEIADLEEVLEATGTIEQEAIALPPHLRTLVEPMVVRRSTHFISMSTVFGGENDVVPLLDDRYMSVFGEYVVYYD